MREIGLADVEREADRQVLRLKRLGVEPGQSIGWLGLNSLEGLGLLYACGHVGARLSQTERRIEREMTHIHGKMDDVFRNFPDKP